jgi:hypothetical protein
MLIMVVLNPNTVTVMRPVGSSITFGLYYMLTYVPETLLWIQIGQKKKREIRKVVKKGFVVHLQRRYKSYPTL